LVAGLVGYNVKVEVDAEHHLVVASEGRTRASTAARRCG
jgi:hypothetical protein